MLVPRQSRKTTNEGEVLNDLPFIFIYEEGIIDMATRTVKLDTTTLTKLDKIGKQLCDELGIKDPSYTQIIEYLLKKAEKK